MYKHAEYFIGNQVALHEVQKLDGDSWHRLVDATPNFGFIAKNLWIRLKVVKPHEDSAWVLAVRYPILDYVDLYVTDLAGKLAMVFKTGDRLPFDSRPIAVRDYVFPLDLPIHQAHYLYLRVQTKGALQVPFAIWNEIDFLQQNQTENLLSGILIGLPLIMVLYNLIFTVRSFDNELLLYAIYVSSFSLFSMSMNGLAFQYLWPNLVLLQELAIPFFLGAMAFGGSLFASSFLRVKNYSPKMQILLNFIGLVGFVLMLGSLFLPYRLMTILSIGLVSATLISALISGILIGLQGDRFAKIFVLSMLPAFFGVVIIALSKFGMIESHFLSDNSPQIGISLQICIVSFALSERLREQKKEAFLVNEQLEMRAREEQEAREVAETLLLPDGSHDLVSTYSTSSYPVAARPKVINLVFPDRKNSHAYLFHGMLTTETVDIGATLFLGSVCGSLSMYCGHMPENDDQVQIDLIFSQINQLMQQKRFDRMGGLRAALIDVDFNKRQVKSITAGISLMIHISDTVSLIMDSGKPLQKKTSEYKKFQRPFAIGDQIVLLNSTSPVTPQDMQLDLKELSNTLPLTRNISVLSKVISSSNFPQLYELFAVDLDPEHLS